MTRGAFTRIDLLGSVRAWRGVREIRLGPPQQRSVLVLLAIAHGQPVPVHEIAEALWEGSSPASAVNVIQTYLKRLRRLLEPERPTRRPSQLLPTVNGGYALRASEDAVDLWRFRGLVRRAREARLASAHSRAAGLLAEALALWQGPPASDLPRLCHHHRLHAVWEEHAAAIGWYAEAALATGVVTEALPLVEQAAAARPFDEPLHARLIRLYHAVGRRSDAVRIYQRSRQRLSEEFGFDPGPELTEAYRQLLHDHRPGPEH